MMSRPNIFHQTFSVTSICLFLGPHHSVCGLGGLPPRQDPGLGQTQRCHFLCQVRSTKVLSIKTKYGKDRTGRWIGRHAGTNEVGGRKRIGMMEERARVSAQWILILFAVVSPVRRCTRTHARAHICTHFLGGACK